MGLSRIRTALGHMIYDILPLNKVIIDPLVILAVIDQGTSNVPGTRTVHSMAWKQGFNSVSLYNGQDSMAISGVTSHVTGDSRKVMINLLISIIQLVFNRIIGYTYSTRRSL